MNSYSCFVVWFELCVFTHFFPLAIIFPPVISVKSVTDDSLHVSVGASEESENMSVNQLYPLIYEVIFWENTSNAEVKRLCSIGL